MPEIFTHISNYFDKHQWAQPAIFSIFGAIATGIFLLFKNLSKENERDKTINQKQKSGHNSINIQIGNYNEENK